MNNAPTRNSSLADSAEYYGRLRSVPIEDVARDLLVGRITDESDETMFCNCPHHASQSGRSLHIEKKKNLWMCRACGVGGDVIHLVEFALSGQVTKETSGSMPPTHRTARDYLADRLGLPRLEEVGAAPEEIERRKRERNERERVRQTMSDILGIYHSALLAHSEERAWLKSSYALSDRMINEWQFGYSITGPWTDADGNHHPDPVAELTSDRYGYTRDDLLATGFFRPAKQGERIYPFFDRRLVFPYGPKGQASYAIGRRGPSTPSNEYENAKYRKLPVHDPEKHPRVSPFVDNGLLLNEQILDRTLEFVVVTEGMTDCLALIDRGIPAISPVTVRFRNQDRDRLNEKLKKASVVHLVLDNEISGIGSKAAVELAEWLSDNCHEVRIATLPLEEKQVSARTKLAEYKIHVGAGSKEIEAVKATCNEEKKREIDALLGDAKIDVNAYFLAGHTADEFKVLLAQASSPLELAIDGLTDLPVGAERDRSIDELLMKFIGLAPLQRDRMLARLAEVTHLKPKVLAEQMKHLRSRSTSETPTDERVPDTERYDCSCIEFVRSLRSDEERIDPIKLADEVLGWFRHHGARLFRLPVTNEPFMYYGKQMFWLRSGDAARKNRYLSLMFDCTEMPTTTSEGRTFHEALALRVMAAGEVRESFSWIRTNIEQSIVYFNLCNNDDELVKISPDGVEIVQNGANVDGVILECSDKLMPITYDPSVTPETSARLIRDLIAANLTCSKAEAKFVALWVQTILLLEFVETKPLLRFEGNSKSGKSTASKLVTTLVYGRPVEKKSTVAANFADSTRNPLLPLDNLETDNLSEGLRDFLLTACTGIRNEKRRGGTDSEVVTEIPKCMIMSTGIEPLAAHLAELSSRTIKIQFDFERYGRQGFYDTSVIAEVKKHRDTIFSGLFSRLSRTLDMLRKGAMEHVLNLLERSECLGELRRCGNYVALMYLVGISCLAADLRERFLTELNPEFRDMLTTLGERNRASLVESNPIATILNALFAQLDKAIDGERLFITEHANAPWDPVQSPLKPVSVHSPLAQLMRDFCVEFHSLDEIRNVSAQALYTTCSAVAKRFDLPFTYKTISQFAQRMNNDLEAIRQSGIEIEKITLCKSKNVYNVRRLTARSWERDTELPLFNDTDIIAA